MLGRCVGREGTQGEPAVAARCTGAMRHACYPAPAQMHTGGARCGVVTGSGGAEPCCAQPVGQGCCGAKHGDKGEQLREGEDVGDPSLEAAVDAGMGAVERRSGVGEYAIVSVMAKELDCMLEEAAVCELYKGGTGVGAVRGERQ